MASNWRSHPRYQGKDLDELPKCTVEELEEIITAPSGGFTMLPDDAFNEVFPNIFIGEASVAKSRHTLKRLGVTHVLNAAKGKGQFWVDTGKGFYREFGIEFLGIEATDTMNFKLYEHFDEAAEFIDNAIKSEGKVLVNCREGVSRSATLVLAYLMLKCKMTAQDAVRAVRAQREISPNPGFMQQLCDLNERLWKENHFEKDSSAGDKRTLLDGKDLDELPKCTVEELEDIITAPSGGLTMLPDDAFNEVYPNIFIGESSVAKSCHTLKRLGVTHVLNAAKGKGQFFVDTDKGFYREFDIEFLGIEATDTMNFKLYEHFDEAAEFIDNAIKSEGKVLVNCREGVSRSATLVLAYLMLKCKMTAQDAVRTVRAQREISPNSGFMQHLCDLNERLWKENHFEKDSRASDDRTAPDGGEI